MKGWRVTNGGSSRLLRIAMLLLFAAYLMGCQILSPKPEPEPFDAKWEVVPVTPFRSMACLEMEDVMRLREFMVRRCSCESKR